MSEKLKITVLGNSVALRTRPVEKRPNNKNYGIILEELLNSSGFECSIENRAFQRATSQDILEKLDDYIATFPDYYILNIGVCDAPTREIPYWFAEIINRKKSSLLKNILVYFRNKVILPKRTFFVKLRGKKQWISEKKFERNYSELLKRLEKDTNARFILLSINLANKRIESILPKSAENYIKYNSIIKKLAQNSRAVYLSLDDLDSEIHYPDGTHFSKAGNKEVANRLYQLIMANS